MADVVLERGAGVRAQILICRPAKAGGRAQYKADQLLRSNTHTCTGEQCGLASQARALDSHAPRALGASSQGESARISGIKMKEIVENVDEGIPGVIPVHRQRRTMRALG